MAATTCDTSRMALPRKITMDFVSIRIIITHHMEDRLGWLQQVGSWQSN
jgi:hypothetical protein